MQKNDKTIVTIIGLVFMTGVIIGQGFSFEVKLGDILALGAALGTLWFANNGIKHNERQYLNTILPVIEKMETHDTDCTYGFSLHNYGSGAALNIEYSIFRSGIKLDPDTFRFHLFEGGGFTSFHFGGELGIVPNSNIDLIKFTARDSVLYRKAICFVRDIELHISYEDVQGRKFSKSFALSPPQ